MSDPKRRCYDLMAQIFVLRESCPEEGDEELGLVDQLDAAWQQLSQGERDEVNRVSAQIACGLLSPQDFARMLDSILEDVRLTIVPAERINRHCDSPEGPLLECKTEAATHAMRAPTYSLGQK